MSEEKGIFSCELEPFKNSPEAEYLRKIQDHPCYDPKAQHKYGRVHLAVAPKCNVKCNFCIRKFDCVTESRPGVTSKLLKPEEALQKLGETLKKYPFIKVVGIAGPGDPLANEETFETLRLVGERFPHLLRCLSTNGLLLPEKISLLEQLGVTNLTVTVNGVDPSVTEKIYSHICYGNRRIEGIEAAKILLDNQIRGIKETVSKGILVKVNSVLIPTINEAHMIEVAKMTRELGVFMMNIIPLIPQDKFSHLRPPTLEERAEIQKECAKIMKQMRHCRQCRADAVGLLGADMSQICHLSSINGNASKSIRVALASHDDSNVVNTHFGHARRFLIYDVAENSISLIDRREMGTPYCSAECGEDVLTNILQMIEDCQFLLCRRIGREPRIQLENSGIKVVEAFGEIKEELLKLK